jgi:LacI family transcriptional regulator
MATIVDVARMAGVSVTTVSQTFSAKRPVSPRTKAKVRAAAARAGYRPSHVAVSMVTGRTTTIGVVVPDIANPFFSELVRGAEAAAMAAGYMTIVCSSELDAALEDRCVEVLTDKRVDALLYLPGTTRRHTRLADPARNRTPLIVIDEELDDLPPGATVITSDNEAGGALAAHHLADLGHREIGVVAGPAGLPTAEARAGSPRFLLHPRGRPGGRARHARPPSRRHRRVLRERPHRARPDDRGGRTRHRGWPGPLGRRV